MALASTYIRHGIEKYKTYWIQKVEQQVNPVDSVTVQIEGKICLIAIPARETTILYSY